LDPLIDQSSSVQQSRVSCEDARALQAPTRTLDS
jgi:hypothetical protein